jgi:hypothetical protein
MEKKITHINLVGWVNNVPQTNEFNSSESILPERYRTLSFPRQIPILEKDYSSITENDIVIEEQISF